MAADKFFRANSREHEEWDGEPKVYMTYAQQSYLYTYVPQWHGIALGPRIPWSDDEYARIEVNAIFRPTREEAEAAMVWHMENACRDEGMIYNPDDWRIDHLCLRNAC